MQPSEEKQKRKVHRSPSYPAFDLNEAIAKATIIYNNERRSATTAEVLASHMGYSAAVGPGGRAVSALRQYGLIEEANGKYRLSDTGYTLVHFDHESVEWKAALLDAAKHPTLFRELLAEYPDDLPSDATLRTDLLKREFNPGSIPDVVAIFRSTMSLVNPAELIHNGNREEPMMQSSTVESGQGSRVSRPMNMPAAISAAGGPAAQSQEQVVLNSWTLSPLAKAEMRLIGKITVDDLETLRDYVEITIKALSRKAKSADEDHDE